jgi:hypothetical protein
VSEIDKRGGYALVKKPSSAVERAAPRVRGILSGMVAETLAIAKKERLARPLFTGLMSDGPIEEAAAFIIETELKNRCDVKFIRFKSATELMKLAADTPFDLIFAYLGNVKWDIGKGHAKDHAYNVAVEPAVDVLGQLKARYDKTVVAVQGIRLAKQFEGTGVTFLYSLYTVQELLEMLSPCLRKS